MVFVADGGISAECPDNSIFAFATAKAQGYGPVEMHPAITKNGILVLFRDFSLSRTCRGKEVSLTTRLSDVTYRELKEYDVGQYIGNKFSGCKVLLLQEALQFATEHHIPVKLDSRIQSFPPNVLQDLFNLIELSGAEVQFSCDRVDFIKEVCNRFPYALIHYEGLVTEEILTRVQNALFQNSLVIWLPTHHKDMTWCTLPRADENNCRLAKRFGYLGLWPVTSDKELETAVNLGADFVKNKGEVKPHGLRRFGRRCLFSELDCINDTESVLEDIRRQVEETHAKGLLAGLKIKNGLWNEALCQKCLSMFDFDQVSFWQDAPFLPGNPCPYPELDLEKMPKNVLSSYLHRFFADQAKALQSGDFDCIESPWEIVDSLSRDFDLTPFVREMEGVLALAIQKNVPLLIRSAKPDMVSLSRYHDLGGRLITFDDCSCDRFNDKIKSAGFSQAVFFEGRLPVQYDL